MLNDSKREGDGLRTDVLLGEFVFSPLTAEKAKPVQFISSLSLSDFFFFFNQKHTGVFHVFKKIIIILFEWILSEFKMYTILNTLLLSCYFS